MAVQRLILNNMPMRGGLATAGKRSTINEAQLWEAVNVYPDLDGMVRGRPGLVQHGQTLTLPSANATNSFYEAFKNTNAWSESDTGSSDYTLGAVNGMLTISQSVGNVFISRQAEDTSADGDYALKFSLRMTNPEQDPDAATNPTTGGSFRVRITGDAGTLIHELVLKATGLFIVESAADVLKYTPTYNFDLGAYHSYEFYYNSADDELTFWFDGEAQDAIDMSGADNVAFAGTCNTVEIFMDSGTAEGAWSCNLTDFQYADMVYAEDALPFVAQRLVDGTQYERQLPGGSTLSSLVVATEKYLYVDIRNRGAWRPLMGLQAGHTFMLPYQNHLMIFDDDGHTNAKVYAWNGVDEPQQEDDAPPTRFGAEYRTRLWAGGDRQFPLRAYYTASRQKDVWFAPEYDPDETFEEVLNAGFVNVPSETGDRIKGIWGEYLGTMIIETDRGVWQVNGSSPASFQIENISKKVGGSSPNGMVQIGNELFMVGTSGVVSVSTAQTYGDLQAGIPSGAIADRWSSLPDIAGRVDRAQLEHAYFDALPSLNIAVLGMRGQGSTVLDKTFVYSALSQQWYGPWDFNPTFFTQIDFGVPITEVLMHGNEEGQVTFTGLAVRTDLGETYERKYSSPMLCGRSLDASLTAKVKRWRTLRLFILPRVNHTFNLRWKTDQNGWQPSSSGEDWSQNPNKQETLNDSFRLNIDRLHSQEDVEIIEVVLDAKGRYFQFELTSDYDFVLQGYQVEFLPGDEEE